MGLLIQDSTSLLPLGDQADVGAARRAVRQIAESLALPRADVGAAELAATELATNVELHAGDGYLLVRALPERHALEMIAVDRGPGITEGARTSGGLGVGLESVARLASTFDLYSRRTAGTVALARFEFGDGGRPPSRLEVAGVSVPVVPLDVNGDGWAVAFDERGCAVMLVDGLGHGPGAHAATQTALRALTGASGLDIEAWLAAAHDAMRSTRGGVAAVARVDVPQGVVQFAGIGNVSGSALTAGASRGLASRPGVLGTEHRVPKPQVVDVPWSEGATLVLWSDGLRSGVRIDDRSDLLAHDPAVVAAALHRDYARGNDDATVVVVQDKPGG